jgi:hypothetical protein
VDWPCDCCPDLSLGLRAIRALGGSRPFPPGPSPRHHHHTRPFSRAHNSLRDRRRFGSVWSRNLQIPAAQFRIRCGGEIDVAHANGCRDQWGRDRTHL